MLWVENLGETWRFHHSGIEWTKLDPKTGMETPTHPYYARPWKWILLLRPISFYVKDYGTDTEQILAIGNPVIFWASVVAIPFVALAWRRLRDWRAGFLIDRAVRPVPAVVPPGPADLLLLRAAADAVHGADGHVHVPGGLRRHDRRPRARHGRGRVAPGDGRARDLDRARLPAVHLGVHRHPGGRRVRLVLADPDRRSHHRSALSARSCGSERGSDRGRLRGRMARREQVRIQMPDGVELSATLFFPDAGEGPWPALLEALPYRKDDVSSRVRGRTTPRSPTRGYVVCWLDVRGTGSSGGIATDEYPAAERDDLVRGDRLARDTALVAGHGRHVRHELRRLQLAAGRAGTAAGAQGDRADLRHRRPLRRRRPLLRRRAEAARRRRLPDLHGGDERAAAGAGVLGRRLARRMAAPRSSRPSRGS